eukprot:scaffold104928_cov28-Tisochrysis_lutea.AAC.1
MPLASSMVGSRLREELIRGLHVPVHPRPAGSRILSHKMCCAPAVNMTKVKLRPLLRQAMKQMDPSGARKGVCRWIHHAHRRAGWKPVVIERVPRWDQLRIREESGEVTVDDEDMTSTAGLEAAVRRRVGAASGRARARRCRSPGVLSLDCRRRLPMQAEQQQPPPPPPPRARAGRRAGRAHPLVVGPISGRRALGRFLGRG